MKPKVIGAALLSSVALVATPVGATNVGIGGGLIVDVEGDGSGANIDAEAGAQAEIGDSSDDRMSAEDDDTRVELGGAVMIDSQALQDQAVYTRDDVRVGVVSDVTVENDTTYLIVTVDEGWHDEVPSIALRARSVMMVQNRLQVDTDEATLRASIEAAAAANANP